VNINKLPFFEYICYLDLFPNILFCILELVLDASSKRNLEYLRPFLAYSCKLRLRLHHDFKIIEFLWPYLVKLFCVCLLWNTYLTVVVYTQPKLTGIGKKRPEIFEIALGGSIKDKFEYAKQNIGKEIKITDIFKEGELVDIHGVSKGKGTQGPVKRFGISIRSHKAEKTKRGPGSLGGWRGQ